MNYRHLLQADLAGHVAAVESFKASINHLRNFLHSDKFTGVESDGERKDWICTGDVLSMLWAMESNALDAGDTAKSEWIRIKEQPESKQQ